MVFGLSGSRNDSQSSSQSASDALGLSYGYQGSTSRSGSTSVSRSRSGGQSASRQRIAFEPVFEALFGDASNVASRLATQAPALTQQANTLFGSGRNFLEDLEGGGAGDAYLEERLSGENPVLGEQIDQLGGDIGRFLSEEVVPGIDSRGVAAGQLGGSRGEVARGEAARAALEQFQRGATELRAGDVNARDAAARSLMAVRTQRAATGLGGLGSVYGLAEAGFGAELSPYAALSSIVGGPTVLSESESEQFGTSASDAVSRALSEAFGEDFSFDRSRSRSRSQSSSSGRSFGLSFGG